MRKSWILVCSAMILGTGIAAEKPSTPTVQRVLLVALVKDASRGADIENSLKSSLIGQGVMADSIRTIFPPSPAGEMLNQIRTRGYDTVLCIAPRKTIQFNAADTSGKSSTLRACLSAYATGKLPSGEALEVNWMPEESSRTDPQTSNGLIQSPMQSNPQAAPMRIVKGTLRLFNVSTESLLSQNNLHVKVPAELQTDRQNKLVARGIVQTLEKSGFFPAKN